MKRLEMRELNPDDWLAKATLLTGHRGSLAPLFPARGGARGCSPGLSWGVCWLGKAGGRNLWDTASHVLYTENPLSVRGLVLVLVRSFSFWPDM